MEKNVVYILEDVDRFHLEDLHRYSSLIDKDRKNQVKRLSTEHDKKNGILSYLLLRYGLKHTYNVDRLINFGYNPFGKPYLKDMQDVFFNISHCNTSIAVGLSNQEIGVDIESYITDYSKIKHLIFSEQEEHILSLQEDKCRYFTKVWTTKESYFKLIGSGINIRPSTICSVNDILPNIQLSYYETDSYQVATASSTKYTKYEVITKESLMDHFKKSQ